MPRKCTHCRTEIPPKAKSDRWQAAGFCDCDCMADHGLAKARQQQQRKREREAKAKRARKPKAKTKLSQTELTQRMFNKMIRLLDDGRECISCGKSECGIRFEAGHFRSVGACPEIRFDPRNCHLQGSSCNNAQFRKTKRTRRTAETVSQEYAIRLRERYSDELVDWLNGPHELPRWRDDDLKALRAVFAAECRRLERGEGPSRDWRAMDYTVRGLIEQE